MLLNGNETVPEATFKPPLHVNDPLSIVEGNTTVPVNVGFNVFAKLFKEVCKSVPFKFIAGVDKPVVKLGLLMFATFVSCVGTNLWSRFNYNAWYGQASADLIDTTIAEIEAGRSQALLPRLKELRKSFWPTYEHRDHYDEKVAQFVKQVQLQRPRDATPPSGTHP